MPADATDLQPDRPGLVAAWTRLDERVRTRRHRFAARHPRVHHLSLHVAAALWWGSERVLPRRRVGPVAVLLVAATVVDSIATYAWVVRGIAIEGNPLVAAVMATYGDGPGLALRALLSATLVVLLAWLARRHWEARAGMILVTLALGGVTVLHLYGLLAVA